MRRLLDFRIVRWEMKVLYVAVAWIVGFVIANPVRSTGAPAPVIVLVDVLINAAAFTLAVRIFRGADEPVEPPRAWWRMTAWPTLSRRLGVLFVVLTAVCAIALGLDAAGVPELASTRVDGSAVATAFGVMLQCAVLAFLYLNSATRMARLGIVKPVPLRPDPKLNL